MTPEQTAEFEALMPEDPIMIFAWTACLRYVVGSAERMAEFRADTGMNYTAPRSPLDSMIDDATGATHAYVMAIARWMNANVWGEVNGRACNGTEPEVGER